MSKLSWFFFFNHGVSPSHNLHTWTGNLQLNSENREHLHVKYVWNVNNCVKTNHKWDLQPQRPQKSDECLLIMEQICFVSNGLKINPLIQLYKKSLKLIIAVRGYWIINSSEGGLEYFKWQKNQCNVPDQCDWQPLNHWAQTIQIHEYFHHFISLSWKQRKETSNTDERGSLPSYSMLC